MSGQGAFDATAHLPPSFHLVVKERVESTNATARQLVEKGVTSPTIVWAYEQKAGRGRRGRAWDSPPGNLYISFILPPEGEIQTASEFGFAAALAVADALERHLPQGMPVTIKWPNDILVQGAKIGGILLESVPTSKGGLAALVLGVGLNIRAAPDNVPYRVTCLEAIAETPAFARERLLCAVAHELEGWLTQRRHFGFRVLRNGWLARAKGIGEAITVRLPRETFHGTFVDLSEDGALILRHDNGKEQRIHVGDVFFDRE